MVWLKWKYVYLFLLQTNFPVFVVWSASQVRRNELTNNITGPLKRKHIICIRKFVSLSSFQSFQPCIQMLDNICQADRLFLDFQIKGICSLDSFINSEFFPFQALMSSWNILSKRFRFAHLFSNPLNCSLFYLAI